ncbi:MAG TPA: M56 family metallopeptidase [Gemmatimonadaceae bacterium]|jgi:beta-lactamase regulating signal transducer with metallopeptidase domain
MIASWMIYTAAITLLLFACGGATEYVARALRAPTRFVWSAVMILALTLSARALVSGRHASNNPTELNRSPLTTLADPTLTLDAGRSSRPDHVATSLVGIQRMRNAAGEATGAIAATYRRIDVAALTRYDAPLVLLWIGMSVAVLAYCAVSLIGIRRIERALRPGRVDEYPVLLSSDIGPALFGVLRSRVVVPQWVLSLAPRDREMILAHERAHAAAFDPALLCFTAIALALQPWNIALWACFARLRLAIETDCDRRVLGALDGVGAFDARENMRAYGRLMVAVYQRSAERHVPSIAFIQRSSNLERRIARMARVPRIVSIGGVTAAFAAVALATTAWMTPPPPRVDAKANGAVASSKSTPCIIDGRLSGAAMSPRPLSDGCTIDGDVMVMVLDSSRVLVAVHEGADDASRVVDYLVFTLANNAAPVGLRWWAHDHAEFRNSVFYIASPSTNIPAMAFGSTSATVQTNYPNGLSLVYDDMEILRHPLVTWNVLRQLPTASKCADYKPRVFVDGVLVEHGDCFVVDGQEIPIA